MSGALILAAGFSRRFGADKRQHLISTTSALSEPLLCVTARRYLSEFSSTIVVVRPEDTLLMELLHTELPQIQIVTAADAHLGMGHSLAAGIGAIRDWRYVFIALGDMPFVEQATLHLLRSSMEELLDKGTEGVIVQPRCNDQAGHPVGFSNHYFSALESLEGDAGARSVIQRAGAHLHPIEVHDEGVLIDIDRPR